MAVIFHFIYGDVILPIDFHSIIFQDGEIAPPTRLVYGTEKKGFFVGENLAG